VEESDKRFIAAVESLFKKDFSEEDIARRKEILLLNFSNHTTAGHLMGLLFP
jgi:hypothetical protein